MKDIMKEQVEVKEKEKAEVFTIKLIWVTPDSKDWDRMEDDGDVAQIEYGAPNSKIFLRKGIANAEEIAHEFGHYIQFWCEREKHITFSHDEEVSNAFEDLTREILRRHLYKEYAIYKSKNSTNKWSIKVVTFCHREEGGNCPPFFYSSSMSSKSSLILSSP